MKAPDRPGADSRNPVSTGLFSPGGRIVGHGNMLNRRGFLGSLAAASALLFWGRRTTAATPCSMEAISLCRCFIAGFQFHQGPALLSTLTAGQQLALKREPANPHDDLAIAVHTASGSKIGYLPQRLNEIPATLMDSNRPLSAVISAVLPKAPPWEAVEVEIRLG